MMPATTTTRCSTPSAMRCSATAATRISATQAGASACRIALCLSALLDAAEGTRADAALTAGCSVSSRRLLVSIERTGRCARSVGNSTARTPTRVVSPTAGTPSPVEVATAVKLHRVRLHLGSSCSGCKTWCFGSSTCRC